MVCKISTAFPGPFYGILSNYSIRYYSDSFQGGPTIIKLQSLMNAGHFGVSAHPDMILSVTSSRAILSTCASYKLKLSVSSPFRGTQLVYALGESTEAAPLVRPVSLGTVLAQAAHLIAFLSPILPRSLDLHIESRALSFHDLSFLDLLKQLWHSDWAQSKDATPYDVTFEAVDEREDIGEGKVHPKTFYRSHAAYMV